MLELSFIIMIDARFCYFLLSSHIALGRLLPRSALALSKKAKLFHQQQLLTVLRHLAFLILMPHKNTQWQ
jgi:hypothetical protein